MKKIVSAILALTLILALLAGCGAATPETPAPAAEPTQAAEPAETGDTTDDTYEYPELHFSAGGVYDVTSAFTIGYYKFAEILEKESGGKITCEYFPNSTLGSDLECAEMVSNGALETAIGTTSNLANFSPEIGLFDLPFLITDRSAAYEVFDSELMQEIYDIYLEKNIRILGIMDQGYRILTSSKKPVTCLDDLKGFKIRVQEHALHMDLWKALGAQPTTMAFGELFTALEQGTVDGQENPLVAIDAPRLYEVQPYMTYSNHVFSAGYIIIDNSLFEGLDARTQELIQRAAKEACAYEREYVQSVEADIAKKFEEFGCTFYELSDMDAWVERAVTIYPNYTGDYKQEWIDAFTNIQ